MLRPLRTIQRNPNLRIIVNVLLACLPIFCNILAVSFFFYFVFAILGVQLFAGFFWRCTDDSVPSVVRFLINFIEVNLHVFIIERSK